MSTEPLECIGKQHAYHLNEKRDQHCTSDARGAWKNCLHPRCPERLQTVTNPVALTGPRQVPQTSQELLIKDRHGLQTRQVRRPTVTPTLSPRLITSRLLSVQIVQDPTPEVIELEEATTSDHDEALKEQPVQPIPATTGTVESSGNKGKGKEDDPNNA